MNIMHLNILGALFLYCVVFAWMSVPFVTTDKSVFRKQVMFIDQLQETIDKDSQAVVVAVGR